MTPLEKLHQKFEYKDGNLYYKTKCGKKAASSKAGSLHWSGYEYIKIDGKQHSTHRIIFYMHHGFLPEEVDHINGIKSDNRIENLRSANRQQNCINCVTSRNSSSGFKNIRLHKGSMKWQVRIMVNGKSRSFGVYENIEDAKKIAQVARSKYHGEFANHG